MAFMFTFVFYLSPSSKAVADEMTKDDARQAEITQILENTLEKKLAHRLEKLKHKLSKELPQAAAKRQKEKGWIDDALSALGVESMPLLDKEVSDLEALKNEVQLAYDDAISQFEAEGEQLTSGKNLSEEVKQLIKERHSVALGQVKKDYSELQLELEQLVNSDDSQEQKNLLDKLEEKLGKAQFKRSHTAEDPNNLPWRSPSKDVREPKLTKHDLQAAIGINPFSKYTQLASNSLLPNMLSAAALGLTNQPTDDDLAQTIDVQITDDIIELAQSLNNSPIEIYTWVHNNIRFIPSYGSIQGAQYTLETKRGNAMDTASLLIALLRASNIPAKYAYGTVEVPVEKVMNWVGGVNVPEAAQSLMGQGGIPNVALVEGGVVKKIRMEHTWVEAYVDFEPSRGINNIEGDNWIPMDASFKQYEFTQGLDLEDNVPFDAQALVDDIEQNAVVNEQEGWIQNVPQANIEAQLEIFQAQIEEYISNQNPDATIGEVLGLQEVKVIPPRPLSAGLPYSHIVTQDTFSEVPNNLRHKFKYELATQTYGYSGSPLITIVEPTVKLAGKKLALSFKPATENDQAIIESYLPAPDPATGEVDPNALPDTLPGYLINLIAEFSIDGQTISEANAGTMGTELHEQLGYWEPRRGWDLSTNNPIAGEYQAIGLDLQGTSPQSILNLKENIKNTSTILEGEDDSLFTSLSKEDLVGDLLESTISSYFALNNIQDELAAQQVGIVNYRSPSYGKVNLSLTTSYWFGVPRNVSTTGMVMDVDRVISSTVENANDNGRWLKYNQIIGNRYSSMENLVPELLFTTPENSAKGISAVKAINLAALQGQKIWTINPSNLDVALNSMSLNHDTETEIRNSVNAGKIVTTHNYSLNYEGWIGEGYIIIDPETGAGAYKIAGGENGGKVKVGFLTKLQFYIGMAESIVTKNKYIKALLAIDGFKSYWVTVFEVFSDLQSFYERCNGSIKGAIAAMLYLALFAILTGFVATLSLTFIGGLIAGYIVSKILSVAHSFLSRWAC
ncbi:transglutaminase domain-containing protein [Oceaniserpentilla sp. 4NH20-0058]|uniref:transglutaminase-like domain-containing protein n=1 Tax=Oceaniserpentilla sp. 4NH20-0058 TaxID=3127660 RepID=UPI0033400A55